VTLDFPYDRTRSSNVRAGSGSSEQLEPLDGALQHSDPGMRLVEQLAEDLLVRWDGRLRTML
jgi:hypothetical protein